MALQSTKSVLKAANILVHIDSKRFPTQRPSRNINAILNFASPAKYTAKRGAPSFKNGRKYPKAVFKPTQITRPTTSDEIQAKRSLTQHLSKSRKAIFGTADQPAGMHTSVLDAYRYVHSFRARWNRNPGFHTQAELTGMQKAHTGLHR